MRTERAPSLRLAEIGIFFALALGLHFSVLWAFTDENAGGESGGNGGSASVTMRAADAGTAALVAEWDARPDVVETPPPQTSAPHPAASQASTSPPETGDAVAPPLPNATIPVLLPDAPPKPTPPKQVAATAFEAEDISQKAPNMAPAPRERPKRPKRIARQKPAPKAPAEPRKAASKPAPQKLTPQKSETARPVPTPQSAGAGGDNKVPSRAAGSGESKAARAGASPKAAPVDKGAQQDALREWGRAIITAVERKKARPQNARRNGVATLVLSVARSGALRDVRVQSGSGSNRLDQAALEAARQAAPFISAPEILTEGSYQFSINMKFQR